MTVAENVRSGRPGTDELLHQFAVAAIENAQPVVFIVDDDEAILSAVGRLLRANGYLVEAFSSPAAFLARKRHHGPGCLILDLRMPELSGIEVQSALVSDGDNIPVVFLSGEPDTASTVLAVKRGAVDFLVKPVAPEILLETVRNSINEHRNSLKRMIGRRELAFRFARLTSREREVAVLVGEGLPNKEIAAQLGTAEKTVKHHRSRAMVKLGIESVAQLVRLLDGVSTHTEGAPGQRG